MLGLGVDVYSAIEIADNAGRTPLFEAVENEDPSMDMIKILTNKKSENGFGANPNVINYSGQTPLFSAARSGSFEAVKALIEAGAALDLNNGELVKPEDDQEDEEYDSMEEQYFLEAFKNCMTPLHVASVLGYDEIALYLAKDCGSDVNI
jgi:ankyrin repeat protein